MSGTPTLACTITRMTAWMRKGKFVLCPLLRESEAELAYMEALASADSFIGALLERRFCWVMRCPSVLWGTANLVEFG